MPKKVIKTYADGSPAAVQSGDTLTYYYKSGGQRAKGKSVRGKMQGKWIFHRESGKLWVTGHLKSDKKHGLWVTYDKKGKEEKRQTFNNGKEVKTKK